MGERSAEEVTAIRHNTAIMRVYTCCIARCVATRNFFIIYVPKYITHIYVHQHLPLDLRRLSPHIVVSRALLHSRLIDLFNFTLDLAALCYSIPEKNSVYTTCAFECALTRLPRLTTKCFQALRMRSIERFLKHSGTEARIIWREYH